MGMSHVYIENYNIGAPFCRAIHEKGGVIIYVGNSLKFSNTDLSKHCKEKDIEICTVNLNLSSSTVCIVTIYMWKVKRRMDLIIYYVCIT
jgi:hypothetical protein